MKTFEINGFEVYDTDGYTHNHVAYVSEESMAVEMTKGNAYMGYNPYKKSFIVFETMDEFNADKYEKLRKSAWAKLSVQERHALGLK